MKRLLILLILVTSAISASAATLVKAKADMANSVISGTVDGKPFSYTLKGTDGTYIIYDDWFGEPKDDSYTLELTLPEGYVALAESDKAEKTKYGWKFTLKNANHGMVLAISDKWQIKSEIVNGVEVALYFSKANMQYSGAYMARIKELLALYTDMFGKYPYGRFAVADVPYPVGHALVSLTFISEKIIPMPFLTRTSLGHELLHQWLGVAVDTKDGNWAEALTTYLADRLYEEKDGKGVEYRKAAIINVMQNARQKEEGTALKDFSYNRDKASQAVGYSKGMMVFSMLDDMLGDDFNKGLKRLYSKFKYKKADWNDVRKVFEDVSDRKLDKYFDGWLNETAIADFDAKDVSFKAVQDGYETSFTLKNKYENLNYPLEIVVKTEKTDTVYTKYIDAKEVNLSIKTKERPIELVIDPNYKTARILDRTELYPALYALWSKYPKAVFVSEKNKTKYASVLKMIDNAEVYNDTVNPYQFNDKIIIFLDADNAAFRKYYGVNAPFIKPEFAVLSSLHPLHSDRMSYIIHADDAETAAANFPRVTHYGKYSSVVSENGRLRPVMDQSVQGERFRLYDDRQGERVQSAISIKTIIDENPYARVFYVGETHTDFAHHENQLEFIRRLNEAGKKIAVGLEMIQKPFQPVLDDYLSGKITEREMLEKTEYYTRWKYDYRLYAPIFRYAKENRIPLVALNTPQEITKKISSGGIKSLTDEELKQIPETIEYTGGEYRDGLYKIFNMHPMGRDFENFYEAQIVWDETMADSAYKYMTANPDRLFVLLAGNGHIRNRTSIPERLFRRNLMNYVAVVQDEDNKPGVADYILYPQETDYDASPMLGVGIDDKDGKLKVADVSDKSAAQTAGVLKDDIIVSFNRVTVGGLQTLKLELLYAEKGREYELVVLRKDKEETLKIKF
ncbi:ChaN family lipoprotein [Seleniivibrio woodruffii]|uniref:ChaN family lipoprotein n=1 Tax=Seleniivibrio woodruffii TaxID=1078050 RepID=UPI0039E40F3F